jgi:transposase-like protein
MIRQVLHCPYCQGSDIVKNGKTPQGKQRFMCREELCQGRTFLLNYAYAGQSRQVKQQIVDMALNGSGIRDTARVLHVSTKYNDINKQRTVCWCESFWGKLPPKISHGSVTGYG